MSCMTAHLNIIPTNTLYFRKVGKFFPELSAMYCRSSNVTSTKRFREISWHNKYDARYPFALLSDILGTDDDVISQRLENEVEIKLLGKAISKLSPREQTIIKLRFGLGRQEGREKTQKEVADLLGISQSYISRLEKRIMKRLKKEIVKYE